jgi:O-antigen biosynthesis protein
MRRNECDELRPGAVLTPADSRDRDGGKWLGHPIPFALEPQDDPLFDRRLVLSGPARGVWIVLTYRADPVARPLRPVLRLTRDDGRHETFVLPGPVSGAARWLGYLPPDCAGLELATDRRSGFVLERVGLRSQGSLFAECILKRPLRTVSAAYNLLRRDERRFRDILRGSCGVTPVRDYERWRAPRHRPDPGPVPQGPRLRLILPASPEDVEAVTETLRTVQAQSFPAWTLLVLWSKPGVEIALPDARITQRVWRQAGVFADLSGTADAIALLTPGDRLEPDALAILVRALSDETQPTLVYADAVTDGPKPIPYLKPDWSPDLSLVSDYTGTPTIYAGALLQRLGVEPLSDLESFPLRLALAATAAVEAQRVSHIPRVLCRRVPVKLEDEQRHAEILSRHLAERGAPARVEANPSGFDLLWPLPDPPPLVSVVIPSRDRLELIRRASDDVLNGTAYPAIELVIVDNGSIDPAVRAYYETLRRDPRVSILDAPGPFNFSALVNAGVAASRGSVVVLLNNDIAVLREDWLGRRQTPLCRRHAPACGRRRWPRRTGRPYPAPAPRRHTRSSRAPARRPRGFGGDRRLPRRAAPQARCGGGPRCRDVRDRFQRCRSLPAPRCGGLPHDLDAPRCDGPPRIHQPWAGGRPGPRPLRARGGRLRRALARHDPTRPLLPSRPLAHDLRGRP